MTCAFLNVLYFTENTPTNVKQKEMTWKGKVLTVHEALRQTGAGRGVGGGTGHGTGDLEVFPHQMGLSTSDQMLSSPLVL